MCGLSTPYTQVTAFPTTIRAQNPHLREPFPGWTQSKKVMSLILDTDDHIFIADTTAELRDQLVSMIPASPTEERLVDLAAAVLGCDTLDIILTHG